MKVNHITTTVLKYFAQSLYTKIKSTFALKLHTHTKSNITDFPTSMPANGGNAATVNGKTVAVNVPADAKFTDTVYTHPTNTALASGLYKITTNSLGHVTAGAKVTKADITALGIPAQDTKYTLPKASSSALGGVQTGYTSNGKNYPLLLDESGKAYVAVPWTDTNTTYSVASQSVNGLMTSADKKKLDGIASGANAYSLPVATASVLGGVKTGANITNTSGTISLTKANVTSALGYTPPTTNTTYSVMKGATTSAAGTSGLVPAPSAGAANRYLRSDGTYAVPPNTTYGVATTSANGLMTSAMVTKLNSIANGANAYVHPSSHPSTMISTDATHRFVTDAQITSWNAKASTAVATSSSNGLMSASDKKRLDEMYTKLRAIEQGQSNVLVKVN